MSKEETEKKMDGPLADKLMEAKAPPSPPSPRVDLDRGDFYELVAARAEMNSSVGQFQMAQQQAAIARDKVQQQAEKLEDVEKRISEKHELVLPVRVYAPDEKTCSLVLQQQMNQAQMTGAPGTGQMPPRPGGRPTPVPPGPQ